MTSPDEPKNILVTGASSGIGYAVASHLLRQGRHVLLSGRNEERVKDLLVAHPGRSFWNRADLAEQSDVVRLAHQSREELGAVDAVVHAAGVIRHSLLARIKETDLLEQMAVNLIAPIRLTQLLLPFVTDGGCFVFISSTLAKRPIETSSVYSASKGGLNAFMRATAIAGAPRGIRANSLSLGLVDTPMLQSPRGSGPKETSIAKASFDELHLLNRMAEPTEVADAVCFVLDTPWLTGSDVLFDGGLSIQP